MYFDFKYSDWLTKNLGKQEEMVEEEGRLEEIEWKLPGCFKYLEDPEITHEHGEFAAQGCVIY